MKAPVVINGKIFVPVKQAAESFNYSRDHLTRLAKSKKVNAAQLGRLWYVNEMSVSNYLADQQVEAQVRQQILKRERQGELQLRNALATTKVNHDNLSENSGRLSVIFACLLFGLFFAAASQVVPPSSISVASLTSSTQSDDVSLSTKQPIKPFFSDDDSVVVTDPNRQIIRPEVTPQWVQITP